MTHSTTGIRHEHLLAVISNQPGPGNFLRTVLIVMVLGAILLAWFLLRGYRQGNETREAPRPERVPASRAAETGTAGGTDRTGGATTGADTPRTPGAAPPRYGPTPGTAPTPGAAPPPTTAPAAEAPHSADAGERSSSED
ncbi:hypothetical protein GA0115251_102018 [Streptomyces sp. TverLS-915]|uniref:hypothetical protein n=1 Tax=Streptomyces sp. TverLS-915 TaxID=1839763 RepID=UPI00081E042D|nr:hypothetical protein [Streptomyces sp. TverLS-915]SCD30009.1 hypothetical protein GA0115251_102018 [Streptomyces sp. TverLS-915]